MLRAKYTCTNKTIIETYILSACVMACFVLKTVGFYLSLLLFLFLSFPIRHPMDSFLEKKIKKVFLINYTLPAPIF